MSDETKYPDGFGPSPVEKVAPVIMASVEAERLVNEILPQREIQEVTQEQADAYLEARKEEARQPRAVPAAMLQSRWLCPNGHTLGVIKTERIKPRIGKAYTKSTLLMFPVAVTDEDIISEAVPVHQIFAGIIVCTKCGEGKEWKDR